MGYTDKCLSDLNELTEFRGEDRAARTGLVTGAGSVGMQRQDGEGVSKGELINRFIVGGEMGCVF